MSNLHARVDKDYPVSALCGLFGVSKQAYYKRDETIAMRHCMSEDMIDITPTVARSTPAVSTSLC